MGTEASAFPGRAAFPPGSIHILLNSLLRKGAIREAGYAKCGKTSGRIYEAALSCAEYYVTTLSSTRIQPGLPELLKAYLAAKPLDEESRKQAIQLLKAARED